MAQKNQVTITIKTWNDAFTDNKDGELARILRELADKIERGGRPAIVQDINGNTTGTVKFN